VRIIIPGPPVPCKRPRAGRNGFYDVQEKEKNDVALLVLALKDRQGPYSGPITVIMSFEMSIPTSWSQKRQKEALKRFHSKKPDLSNLVKFYEDALNGILWRDDAIICEITATKIYSNEPKTVITVEEIGEEDAISW